MAGGEKHVPFCLKSLSIQKCLFLSLPKFDFAVMPVKIRGFIVVQKYVHGFVFWNFFSH